MKLVYVSKKPRSSFPKMVERDTGGTARFSLCLSLSVLQDVLH